MAGYPMEHCSHTRHKRPSAPRRERVSCTPIFEPWAQYINMRPNWTRVVRLRFG